MARVRETSEERDEACEVLADLAILLLIVRAHVHNVLCKDGPCGVAVLEVNICTVAITLL